MVRPDRAADLGRPGRFFRRVSAILALSLLCLAPAAKAAGPEAPIRGHLILKGKSLTFSRAWLVRGPDTGDETKPSAYLILSSRDISSAITACQNIKCVLWDAMKEGAILEPIDDGHESFWLRVVSPELPKEYQLSGRRWVPATDQHDRLSGTLEFSYSNTKDEADLQIDAVLLKEFPVHPH